MRLFRPCKNGSSKYDQNLPFIVTFFGKRGLTLLDFPKARTGSFQTPEPVKFPVYPVLFRTGYQKHQQYLQGLLVIENILEEDTYAAGDKVNFVVRSVRHSLPLRV